MKKIILLSIFTLALTTACKKTETKPADPTPVTPAPTSEYASFTTTVAAIDYTASAAYTLTPSSNLVAYVVADGVRIDTLPLVVTKLATPPIDACMQSVWATYNQNVKTFRVKKNTNDSLQIFDNGVKVSSILIDQSGTVSYNYASRVNPYFPAIVGSPCSDNQRFILIE